MKKVISIILCLAWMGFIFYNSSQNGVESNARSEEFLKSIKKYYIEMKNTVKKPESIESFKVDKKVNKVDNGISKNNSSSSNKIINNTASFNEAKNIQDKVISPSEESSDSNEGNKNKTADKKLKFQNYLIRRGAHAFEYIILAILLGNLFVQFNAKNKNVIIYILFISLLYAVLDEFHQKFVPNRTSEVGDVLLDFSGAILGTAVWCFWQRFRRGFKKGSSSYKLKL